MAMVRTNRNVVIVLVVLALLFGVGVGIVASAASAGTGTVYVATGENFPDALGAGATGGVNAGPVLLVQRNAISAATLNEINRLEPFRIVIVGGTGVVSQAVEDQLKALSFGPIVVRLGGANRYETAALLSQSTFPVPGAVSCPSSGFLPPDTMFGYEGDFVYRYHTVFGFPAAIICAVSIPDGAKVTGLSAGFLDEDADYNSSCRLVRTDLVGGSFGLGIGNQVQVAATSSTTGSSAAHQLVSTSDIVDALVDNSRYGYAIHCSTTLESGLVGATVEYELTG
jgi:hypothetical protein